MSELENPLAFIKAILHRHFPREDASDDVLQAGHLGIWLAKQDWDQALGASFTTWATHKVRGEITRVILARRPFSGLKRGKKRIRPNCVPVDHEVADGLYLSDILPAREPTPEEQTAVAEHRGHVRAAVSALPADQAAVVSMWMDGKTFDEMAPLIGKTRQRAHQLFQMATKRLGKTLSP